jgi:hypothetical protein
VADTNQGVVYTGPGQVEVQDLDYPKLLLAETSKPQCCHTCGVSASSRAPSWSEMIVC